MKTFSASHEPNAISWNFQKVFFWRIKVRMNQFRMANIWKSKMPSQKFIIYWPTKSLTIFMRIKMQTCSLFLYTNEIPFLKPRPKRRAKIPSKDLFCHQCSDSDFIRIFLLWMCNLFEIFVIRKRNKSLLPLLKINFKFSVSSWFLLLLTIVIQKHSYNSGKKAPSFAAIDTDINAIKTRY